MTAQSPNYAPRVFVDTTDLSREEWLAYRRQGIGGSDAASIMGLSPFRTARDIYYDKLGLVTTAEYEGNWVALKMGHLLEDLVAEIFTRKTGLPIFKLERMFQHPLYPFMLADVDFFITLPNGQTAILEIKTTNYNAKSHWWSNGQEIVPEYYEAQGRHYMAVMNVDEVYFCCLYGNNEDEVIIRHIERDCFYESELIFLEQCFWTDHVLARIPPPYTEDAELIEESLKRHVGLADPEKDAVQLSEKSKRCLEKYLELQACKADRDQEAESLNKEMKRLRALIIAEMGDNCTAYCEVNGSCYKVTYNPVQKASIMKKDMLRMQTLYPEAYRQFVTTSEYRTFRVSGVPKEQVA